MKEIGIYAVKDELTQAYLTPQFIGTDDEALRIFAHQINNIPLWKDNASDYTLYWLGTFDVEEGITGTAAPKKIASGHTVLKKGEKNDLHSVEQTA